MGQEGNVTEEKEKKIERVIWETYPSWRQFGWLYLFALWTGMRGLLLIRLEVEGWELWMGGVVILLGLVVALRHWAKYIVTTQRVVLRNGYSGKDMDSIPLDTIKSVEIHRGPIAAFLGIGTVAVQEKETDRSLRFRGVSDPAVPVEKLNALRPSH